MIVILFSSVVKNVLNRSFTLCKLPYSVRFRLAIKQNSGSCKNLKLTLLFFSSYLRKQSSLLIFTVLILLSQCSEPPPAEQQIITQLERAKTSIEKLEAAELRDVLADDFEVVGDNKQYDYERIKKTMLVFGLRKQKINIFLSAATVTLDPYNSQLASLESNVLITGSRGLLPDDGRLYKIESQWRLFNDEWKITRLSWK